VILSHFSKYPLISQKKADFELFKLAVEILNRPSAQAHGQAPGPGPGPKGGEYLESLEYKVL